jgi:hypothetical protein
MRIDMTEEIEKLSPAHYEIIKELSTALWRGEPSRGVFAALNSWGDTMPEIEVLRMLKELNGN